jgi:hypothetical protein
MDKESSQKYIYDTTVELLTVKPEDTDYFPPSEKISRSQRKFYKKRIIQLIKELLLAKPGDTQHNHVPESIKELLDTLVFESIEYFEMLDTTDIINADKLDTNDVVFESDDPLFGGCNNSIDNDEDVIEELCKDTINNNDNNVSSSLDDFIIRTTIDDLGNSCTNTSQSLKDDEEDYEYARIKTINLRDSSLKTKGIYTKKSKVVKDKIS